MKGGFKRSNKLTSEIKISKGRAVFFMLVLLWLGIVFAIITPHSSSYVERSEAVYFKDSLLNMEFVHNSRGNLSSNPKINGVNVDLSDSGRKFIRQCVTEDLVERLKTLETGDELALYLRPNSNDILGIEKDGEIILDFDEAQRLIGKNARGFIALGVFCFLGAVFVGIFGIFLR